MNSDRCPDADQLTGYVIGTLPADSAEMVADHLEHCPACDDTVASLEASNNTMLRKLREPAPSDPLQEELAFERAVQAIQAIGREPSFTSVPKAADRLGGAASELGSIGGYQLLEKLGEGGMGAVYKALHTKLNKVVAIKVLPAERMKDQQAVARFEREMQAVGRLEHANIVRAMDAGEVDGVHFLVMEYVKGLDLSEISRRLGPLPLPTACELIRQAAIGLDEAHDQDMVHRDIKPSNLILAERRRKPPVVKILDMGLALLSDAHSANAGLTTTGQMMGTLDYMAPEQGGDSKSVDIRADIYALGATLYRLLCGQVIYHGEQYQTPLQKMRALATEPAPPIQSRCEGIPDELAAIVHRMLEKDPAARFAAPQEVADALAPFCAGADLSRLLTEGARRTPATDAAISPTDLGVSGSDVDTDVTENSDRFGELGACREREASLPGDRRETEPPSIIAIAASRAAAGSSNAPATTTPGAARKTPSMLLIAGGAGLLGILAAVAATVFYFQTPQGALRVEIDDPDIEVKVEGENIILTNADKEPVELKAGQHLLIVTRGDFTFRTQQFTLTKGETTTVKVELLPGKVQVVSAGTTIGSHALAKSGNTSESAAGNRAPPLAIAPFNADQAKQHQQAWADYLGVPMEKEIVVGKDAADKEVKLTMVLVPPGEFLMGASQDELSRAAPESVVDNDQWIESEFHFQGPQHRVRITKPFYLGKFEITQAQWESVMGINPSEFKREPTYPVERVTWEDCQALAARLNETTSDALKFALPTEAQWEYACRAGTSDLWCFGEDEAKLREYAWYGANSDATHPVGQLAPNPFGLHDLHGNVSEWCSDLCSPGYYADSPVDDPSGGFGGSAFKRSYRGGSWQTAASDCRSAFRGPMRATAALDHIGVRLAAAIDVEKLPMKSADSKGDSPTPDRRLETTIAGDWSEPVNLGPMINSDASDGGPMLSPDGLTLLFDSNRENSVSPDLWMAKRASTAEPWSKPVNFAGDYKKLHSPTLSSDGLRLLLVRDVSVEHIYTSRRNSIEDPWSKPVLLDSVSWKLGDGGPTLSADGLTLIFHRYHAPGGQGLNDLCMSTRSSVTDAWSTPVNLGPPINCGDHDRNPSLSADGLSLAFESIRIGNQGPGRHTDIWMSTRASTSDPWRTPVNLGPRVNGRGNESSPALSADGRTLFFSAERLGEGGHDLWMSTRVDSPSEKGAFDAEQAK